MSTFLDETAAAEVAGVDTEAIRRWVAMGYLDGPPYDINAIRELLDAAWQPRQHGTGYLTPQQASLILRAGTPTLGRRAREGRITRRQMPGGKFAYDGAQVRAIAAERERLRDPKWWPPVPEPSR